MSSPFVVGYVPGVTPGKWERIWRERMRRTLRLVQVSVEEQESAIRSGDVAMCLVRGAIDRDGMHLIPLYTEVPVVVAFSEHPVAAFDEIDVAELAQEYQHPESLSVADAIEAVAAGTGVVVVPKSIARLHHRKDVVAVPVTGVEESPIGLAWLIDNEDEDIQSFIGIVRGRSANSSR